MELYYAAEKNLSTSDKTQEIKISFVHKLHMKVWISLLLTIDFKLLLIN